MLQRCGAYGWAVTQAEDAVSQGVAANTPKREIVKPIPCIRECERPYPAALPPAHAALCSTLERTLRVALLGVRDRDPR